MKVRERKREREGEWSITTGSRSLCGKFFLLIIANVTLYSIQPIMECTSTSPSS